MSLNTLAYTINQKATPAMVLILCWAHQTEQPIKQKEAGSVWYD